MSPALFALTVALALGLGVASVGLIVLIAARTRAEERLAGRLQDATPALTGDEFGAQAGRPLLSELARGGRRIERWVDTGGESARLLVQAGWRSSTSRLSWYAFQALCPMLAVLLALLLWLLGRISGLQLPLVALGLLVAALLLPRGLLRRVAHVRQRHIQNEVPLFIHLLVLLFEAGLSTRQAIASLVREGGGVLPELGREFELLLRQLEAGGDTAEVIKSLSDTLEVTDLSSVLSVLRQVDRYGGEIREPLLEAMAVLEQRRDLDLRETVNRMSGKMTIVMVLFFFPALLIFVAGPAFLSIIRALAEVTAR